MPRINGIEVGKEILAVNPRQRIIFAFAYPLAEESLIEPFQGIKPDIEILQKPFTQQTLVDKVEDKEIYSELQQLNVDIDCIKAADFRHDQLREDATDFEKAVINKLINRENRNWDMIRAKN